jgi:hypothetical protein
VRQFAQLLAAVDAKSDEKVIKKLQFAPRRDVALPEALRALLLRDDRVNAVETRFVWRVEAAEESPLPSFRQVTSAMPSLWNAEIGGWVLEP